MAFNTIDAFALRPEAEVLLYCARTHMDAENADRLRQLLRKELDWDYLRGLACQHGVMPLLYRNLHATAPEAVPGATLEALREHFHANAFFNCSLVNELIKLLDLLDRQGISAIPFKGPILATTVYGNLALREFLDLDILVHERDLVKAKDLLFSAGYHLWQPLTDAQEASHLHSEHSYTFIQADRKVHVDLHWRLTQRHHSFALDPERLWARAPRVSLAGRTVLSLPPEEMLLILCMHGAKHYWERLGWVCDVAELIRACPELDYKWLLTQAADLNSNRFLTVGLFLAEDFLGASLPEYVSQRVQDDPQVKPLARRARELLFSEDHSVLRDGKRLAFYFRMKERVQDRIPYFLHHLHHMVVPNEADLEFVRLPGLLSFLYYVLRPLRLTTTYAWLSLKRMYGGNNGNSSVR